MFKVIKEAKKEVLYRCEEKDTLQSIAANFGTSANEILRNNPNFTGVYNGCMLLIRDFGKTRVTVAPLENLDDIALRYNTTKEEIMQTNSLKSEKVFLGMQLLIDTQK